MLLKKISTPLLTKYYNHLHVLQINKINKLLYKWTSTENRPLHNGPQHRTILK